MGEDAGPIWSSLPAILTALGGTVTALATLVGALYAAGLLGRRKSEAAPARETPAAAAPTATPTPARAPVALRRIPGILSADQVKATLVQHRIYDARWNASASGPDTRHEAQLAGDALVVVDGERELTWQRAGSPDPMTYAGAEAYVRKLNAELFGGARDWRLPTIEEAGTLLSPAAHAGYHLDPVFEKGASFIWTADRHPDGRIWMVYFADGMLDAEKPEFNAWVRAVR